MLSLHRFGSPFSPVRCDIPAHVYQSTFEPNTQWSEKFAQGAEICDYWQGVARKHNVYQYVKLRHQVQEADWNPTDAKWEVRVQSLETGEVFTDRLDFLITAIGRFNAWKLPEYPGMDEYKGLVRHAQNYDPSFDPKGKRVAVIGNGASGIQLTPNLQRLADHVDHYARNKTWIATSWAGDERTFEPQRYSEEELASFKDPAKYHQFRKELEDKYWRSLEAFFKGTDASRDTRSRFIEVMKQRLARKPELLDAMIPDFSPNCRRLTPGPGYLEALCEPNVAYITTPIARFTATGIQTTDGAHRPVDAVFCATGATTDLAPPFAIRALGADLRAAWAHGGAPGFPFTYLGLAAPRFPNLLFLAGPHATGPAGTLPHAVETQVTYCARVLRKASTQGIRSMAPAPAAARDFLEYSDAFFATTVLSEACSSWYNGGRPGGRVHGVWPGSAAHLTAVRQEPRWEDWEYEYLGGGNRFAWFFGTGRSRKEGEVGSDMTGYLESGDRDLRAVHERWWVLP